MAYEKTYDLLDLAIWMQSTREGVSLNEIAEKYQVSRRTAERMRDMIIARFPQAEEIVCENKQKRWYIPQGTLKDLINFSAEELSVLETAKELFENKQMAEKSLVLDKVIAKIKACIKPDVIRRIEPDTEALLEAEGFICRPGPRLVIDEKIIVNIRQAILECHQIQIKYYNQSTDKISINTLNPYGFLYGEHNHYLVAHHADGYYGNEMHNFILSNIKEVKILESVIVNIPDFSLQKYAEESFGAYHEKPFDVEWLFDKEVAKDAEHYIFHPTQTMLKNPDGTLTVKFRAGGRLEMDWHLYTWGNHVKVIKPKNWLSYVIAHTK